MQHIGAFACGGTSCPGEPTFPTVDAVRVPILYVNGIESDNLF